MEDAGMSDIAAVAIRLEREITRLESRLQEVYTRLQPALGPRPTLACTPVPAPDLESPLGQILTQSVHRIASVNDRLQSLMEACEL